MFVAPIGVVTVTFLALRAAPAVTAQLAFTVVAVDVIPVQVMPPPAIVTAVAPVRLVPVMVTGTVVPWVPDVGLIEISVGPCTENAPVKMLVVPIGVTTLTFLALTVAPAVIAQLALTVPAVDVMPLHVTPVPEIVTAVAPTRFVPIKLTGTLVPRTPVPGVIEVSVGPCTVNAPVKVFVVPIGVVTLTFLALRVAAAVIAQVALTVVAVDVIPVQVTPVPEIVTAVAPVRFVPSRVTGTLVPRTPLTGEMEASVAPCTVNAILPLVPPGVVTLTFLAVSAAVAEIVNVVVAVVAFVTVTVPTVTPPPEMATVVPAAVKFVPVSVTGTAVPRTPVLGTIDASVGTAGLTIVNGTVLLAPPGVVVTLTFLAVRPAPAAIAKFALTVVSLTTARPLTVTPPPDTVIAVVPARPLPVRVSGMVVPRAPDVGEIEVSNGPTVKVCALLVPPGVVTVTLLAESVAAAEIVNVAVIVDGFTTVTPLTVTPVPETATVVPVAVKLAPVSVTGTAVLRTPPIGATEVSVGAGAVTTTSEKFWTAFGSTPLLAVNMML